MRGQLPAALLLLLLAFWPGILHAETGTSSQTVAADTTLQRLELQDGSVLFGRVLAGGDPFLFRLTGGTELWIDGKDLRTISPAADAGSERPFDPNTTRLFFGPTARTLPKGKGYASLFELVIPFIGYGLTDNLLLSGGTPFLAVGDEGSRLFWLTSKWRALKTDELELALGALGFATLDGESSAGILFGVLSQGTERAALHAGLGYGVVDGGLADHPALLLGGEWALRPGITLLSENYLLPGGNLVLGAGPRFYGKRFCVDLGLLMPYETGDSFFLFPMLNLVWNW